MYNCAQEEMLADSDLIEELRRLCSSSFSELMYSQISLLIFACSSQNHIFQSLNHVRIIIVTVDVIAFLHSNFSDRIEIKS